jgi:hypothetical protein
MAENVQKQFGKVYKNLEEQDKPFDYRSVSITDIPVADLDNRFFSGQSSNPVALREAIDNSTGYKSFTTYYDMYLNSQGPNRQKLTKEELAEAIQRNIPGTESLGFLRDKDGRVTPDKLDDSPVTPFEANMTYEDKIKALVANQGSQIYGEGNQYIGHLPIHKMIKEFDPKTYEQTPTDKFISSTTPFNVDEEGKLRLPNVGIDVAQEKQLVSPTGETKTVTMPDKTIYPLSDKSGKGAVVLDFNNRVVSFKGMLDNYTDLNEYQKMSIVKAKQSGQLDKIAGPGQLGRDTVAGVGNLALWGLELVADAAIKTATFFGFIDEFKDPNDNPVQKKGGVDFGHINYAAEEFSKNAQVKQSTADLIFRWSPSITETAIKEFVGGAVVAGPFQAFKIGKYFLKEDAFRNAVIKKYGKKGMGFEEAYANAINKKGKTPDQIIGDYVKENTRINSIRYRNWKAAGVMNAIQRSSEYRKVFSGSPAAIKDLDIVEARIASLKKRQESLEDKRTIDPKWEQAYKNTTDELETQISYRQSLFIRNILPQDLREALTTEAGISYGISLLKNTQQAYFPDSNEAMFEIGGVVLGNYATAPISNRVMGVANAALSSKNLPELVGNVYRSILKGTNQQKADTYMRLLGGANPKLFARMEAGILRAEEITTKVLSLKDRNGQPLIKDPEIIINTLANISTLDILRSKAGQLGDKLSVKGMDTLNDEFQRLSENIISQTQLNTELSMALRELANIRFSPDVDPSIKTLTEGLEKYLRNSQSQVSQQVQHFSKDIDDTQAFLLMEASGIKLTNTPGAYTDYDTTLDALNISKAELMRGLGYKEKDIIQVTNARIEDFKLAVLEGTNKANITTTTLPSEIGISVSTSFIGTKKSNFKLAGDKFTILRENNRNAQMDFSPVYDQYLNGIEETVIQGGDAAKAMRGLKVPTVIEGKLGNVFEESARNFFKSNPKIQPIVDRIREQYPDASNLQIWSVLKKGGEGFAPIPNLKLPIDFEDYRLVMSSLSQESHKFGGKSQTLPIKEIRNLMTKTAEDEKTGFKIGLLQPDGGTSVGPEVVASLKDANATWQNTAAIYESGIGKKWEGYSKDKLANGMIKYGSKEQDPVNWFASEIKSRKNLNTPAGVTEFNNLFSEMASVYGGKLVSAGDEVLGTPARYEFIAGNAGTQTFKKNWIDQMKYHVLTETKAGKNMLELHKNPKLQKQFLTQDEMSGGRINLDYKEEDIMYLIGHMKQAKMRDPRTGELVDMFNDNDIQDIFDSIGIEQLALKSDIARKAVSNVKQDYKKIVGDIRNGKGADAIEVKAQMDLAKKFGDQLSPSFIYTKMQEGERGLVDLDRVRTGYIKSLVADKSLTVAQKELKTQQYDRYVASQFMEKVVSLSQEKVMGQPSLALDMTAGAFLDNMPMKINPKPLLDSISGGPLSDKDAAIKDLLTRGAKGLVDNKGKPIDPEQFYDDMVTIAELVAGKEPTKIGSIALTGIPTGLSVESYISRVYSVARGVVSLKYLMTEAVLQTARVQKFNAFSAMIKDPEIARLVVKAIKTGKPIRGEDAVLFDQLLLSAVARQSVKYASSEEGLSRPAVGQEQYLFEDSRRKQDLMARQGLIEGGRDTIMKVGPGDVPTISPAGRLTGSYNVQPFIETVEEGASKIGSQMEQLFESKLKQGSPLF